jgi:flagellar protein FlaG
MSTDITRTTEPQQIRVAAALPGTPAPAPAAKVIQAAPEVKLALPEKPDVKFNPKEMQKNLQDALDRLNDQMKSNGRHLNFSIDKALDRTVIQVKNAETGEVIRQIPDETLLRVAHNIEQVKGMLLDEKL